MFVVLGLGLVVLLEGLQIRRGRVLRQPYDNRRHRRFARVFVLLAGAGFASGLASMGLLRGKPVFGSVHALLTSAALCGFVIGGVLGLRLERNLRTGPRMPHAAIASGGLLFAFAALVAGFAILP
jgi:cytochrome bd-type quinol oxidase subunit 1